MAARHLLVPVEMVARLQQLDSAVADLLARLPAHRRDIHAILELDEPADLAAIEERQERHLGAVEAVLRERFGHVWVVPDDWWESVAQEVLAAAEVGI